MVVVESGWKCREPKRVEVLGREKREECARYKSGRCERGEEGEKKSPRSCAGTGPGFNYQSAGVPSSLARR